MDVIYELTKIGLLSSISVTNYKELLQLKDGSEDFATFRGLLPESLLLRWVNYHLAKAGSKSQIKNFSEDIKDGTVYATLLFQLCPEFVDALQENNPKARIGVLIIRSVADSKGGDFKCGENPTTFVHYSC